MEEPLDTEDVEDVELVDIEVGVAIKTGPVEANVDETSLQFIR